MAFGGTRVGSLRLNFSNARLSLPKLLDALEGLPYERIEELDASQNDLGDRSPKKLLKLLPQLRTLRLNRAGLSAEGVRCAIEALTERWLECTQEASVPKAQDSLGAASPASTRGGGPAGSPNAKRSIAPPPVAVCKLQALEMAACNAEAAVPDLALYLASPCCSLTELDLSWNSLGPHAVQQLGWHLRQNVTLRSLKLAHCHLKQSASVLLASLSTAQQIPLERLDLSRNDMPTAAFQELASFLSSETGQRLKDLDLSGNGATVEESCSRVLGKALLEDAASTASFCSSPQGGSGMKLHLGGTKPFFDPAYGRWDAGPQLLTVLRSPNSRVLEVTLDHCTFAEAAVSSLARICLNVRSFSLGNCEGAEGTLGQSFVVHLEDLTRGLYRRRGDPDMSSPRASEYTPGGTQATRGTRRPRPLRVLLKELKLNDLQLQDGSVQLLCQALHWLHLARRETAAVEVLELEGNHLSHEGVVNLNLTSLRRLSLSRNKLRPPGGLVLGDLLAHRGDDEVPLLDLELRRCGLNSDGILGLWQQVLPDRARVRRLHLAENNLDAATVQAMLDIARDMGGASFLQELQLLPNPCGNPYGHGVDVASRLFQHMAPWKSICLQSAEMSTLTQLMGYLGDLTNAGQVHEEFVVSLQSLHVLPNQWSLLKDALAAAIAPPLQLTRNISSSPWRRLGGCGGTLRLEFQDCDLSQAHFRAPRVETPEVGTASIAKSARRECSKGGRRVAAAKSLAMQARYASGEDLGRTSSSSSQTPFRPALRVAASQGNNNVLGRSQGKPDVELSHEASTPVASRSAERAEPGDTSIGFERKIPALRVCREENFGILFERKCHVDLQVCTVLRELRNVQGLRLVRCSLTDNWLSQLGHSGNSSKWSAIRLLDLRYNALTSSSCPGLATVISGGLQALLLDGNRLQSHGFEALCKVLMASKRALRWLSVADNELGHPCGTLAADLFAQGQCSLKELSLAVNSISSGEIVCFLRTLAKLGISEDLYIDLAQTAAQPQVLPVAAKALARCPGLVINLKGCRSLTSEHFEASLHGLPPGRLLL